jgi:transposase
MTHFITGESRTQSTLFPEALDDYISEENPVRVVDVFVDSLNLKQLGFNIKPADTGRPAYHPATMLKLFIYGYLNRVQSSRRLEREAARNVELMWLLSRLTPNFKTIADFRKDNSKGIQAVCREFVLVCNKLELFADSIIAIDGSKFKAVNNRDRNFTPAKLKYRQKVIDESIAKYLRQIESADRQETPEAKLTKERLENKIASLKKETAKLNEIQQQLNKEPDKQLSLTDPDARSMKTRGQGIVGYNVQIAVDNRHHLIVTHDVLKQGNDRDQLSPMAIKTKKLLKQKHLIAISDRGYFNSLQIKACDDSGIETYLPKSQTSGNLSKGLFGRGDFIYKRQTDEFICPAGERLPFRTTMKSKGRCTRRYWASTCGTCELKPRCTTGRERRIDRWEHEHLLDNLESRMAYHPDMMKIRRSTVEHPFGTIKSWMSHNGHFLMKTLKHVSTEMSLHILSYNMKRVMNMMGTTKLMEVIRA